MSAQMMTEPRIGGWKSITSSGASQAVYPIAERLDIQKAHSVPHPVGRQPDRATDAVVAT